SGLGAVDGLEAVGRRGLVAFGAHDTHLQPADHPDPIGGCLDEHHALAGRCAARALVGVRLGVATLLSQSAQLLAASIRTASEYGWGVHTHLAEVREELVQARPRWGQTSLDRGAD